jgi:hypothetical protein
MQMYAREWSVKFNKFNTPKHVKFIKAAVLQLADRPGRPLYSFISVFSYFSVAVELRDLLLDHITNIIIIMGLLVKMIGNR